MEWRGGGGGDRRSGEGGNGGKGSPGGRRGGGGVAGDGLRLIEGEGVVMCTYWGWVDIPWC